MSLGRAFRIFDDSGNKQLDIEEASKAFNELRIGLSQDEITRAFRVFDRSGDGNIDYDEFLRVIRGEMN